MEYTLIRSNRRSVGITIRDGNVYVRAPQRMSHDTIDGFIADKKDWINAKLKQSQEMNARLLDYANYNKFLYLGETYSPRFCKTPAFMFIDGELLIPLKRACDCENVLNVKLIKDARAFYIKLADEQLRSALKALSESCAMPFCDFSITNAKTKWGSCDSLNNIKLNWRLIFFEPCIIRYVIIHELCHTKQHNHSAKFWQLVESLEPNCKNYRKELKKQSSAIDLFR